jgi:asparagine synthase (glutamine-hydrolysing)
MRHHSWYAEQRQVFADGVAALARLGLGFVNTAPQPASNEDRTVFAVLDGEIYDHDRLRSALEKQGHCFASTSPAELLVHGFESQGSSFFAGLNGKFIAALWDSRSRRLVLITDRFGMRPLYYAPLKGRLLFSSEIKALLAEPGVSRRMHVPAVAQFFHFGQIIDESTFYDGIHLLPAGSCLVYEAAADQPTIERYWRMEQLPTSANGSRTEILDRIADAFDRAVDRATMGTEKLGLSLSGGLDARTILGCTSSQRALTTLCLGMEGSMDLRCAAEMARVMGRLHHEVILDERFLANFGDHLRYMVDLTDGHYLCQCIVMPTLPVYRELGIEVLLRGHAGELMHMTKAYNFSVDRHLLSARDDDTVEQWMWQHLQAYILDGTEGRLFAASYRGRMEEMAREALQGRQARLRGTVPPVQQAGRMFLDIRLRRETALSLVEFGSLVETRLPYLDNELVERVLAAPMELKLDDTIQRHILARRCPEFLKIVNVNTGAAMTAGPLGRLFGKVRQKVLSKLGVKGYQPYERLGLWLRRELRPLVEGLLLDPRCLDRGLFDPQGVRDVVHRHWNNQANHTYLLLAMMIFEVGQRAFVDADPEPLARVNQEVVRS